MTLQNNGTDTLSINSTGGFTFPTALASGSTYNISISLQPSGQTCTVTNGAGTVDTSNVTNIGVNCVTITHTVNAAISGLSAGSTMTLQNNTTDSLTASADGTYPFSQKIAEGATYAVTVATQPTGQTCTVSNGSGTMGTTDVTASVSCVSTPTHSVGGTLSGLAQNAIVQVSLNNGGSSITVPLSANGSFTLSDTVAEGSSYAVTIATANQPSGQICGVTNGTGTMGTTSVTNVGIACQTAAYSMVYSFGDNSSGSEAGNPQIGGLVADASGNLYGTTPYGGSGGTGAIFKLTPNGSGGYNESILFDFHASGYSNPLGTMVYDRATNMLYGTASTGDNTLGQQGGAVFKISADGPSGGIQVVHEFLGNPSDPSADGYTPEGDLAFDGTYLYGTTYNGGSTNERGCVYRVKPDGSGYMILHHFNGNVNNDGSNPQGGVMLDPATNTLYGTTPYGCDTSACNSGTVFSIHTDGTGYAVLHGFTGATGDGANPYGDVALMGSTLYGTTNNGGNGYGVIFKVNTDGSGYSNLYSLDPSTDGINPQAGLLAHGGMLYGTALSDTVNSAGTVFKIAPDGTGFTVLHPFTFNPDGASPLSPMMFDPVSGFIYGETRSGGAHGIGSVFRVAP
ncbi:MAG: hypothetical protein IE913_02840 [Halothiobacillus sp.]|nr:hypothetical protein [Halothiobacillus sp.]